MAEAVRPKGKKKIKQTEHSDKNKVQEINSKIKPVNDVIEKEIVHVTKENEDKSVNISCNQLEGIGHTSESDVIISASSPCDISEVNLLSQEDISSNIEPQISASNITSTIDDARSHSYAEDCFPNLGCEKSDCTEHSSGDETTMSNLQMLSLVVVDTPVEPQCDMSQVLDNSLTPDLIDTVNLSSDVGFIPQPSLDVQNTTEGNANVDSHLYQGSTNGSVHPLITVNSAFDEHILSTAEVPRLVTSETFPVATSVAPCVTTSTVPPLSEPELHLVSTFEIHPLPPLEEYPVPASKVQPVKSYQEQVTAVTVTSIPCSSFIPAPMKSSMPATDTACVAASSQPPVVGIMSSYLPPISMSAASAPHLDIQSDNRGYKGTLAAIQSDKVMLLPFSKEQLKSLYYNEEIEQNAAFIEKFLKEIKHDKSEFYELVLSYYLACNHFADAEQDLKIIRENIEKREALVWITENKIFSVNGICLDKVKVSAEQPYETVSFCKESLQDLDLSLMEIRKKLHEDLAIYSHEVQLYRLQIESFLYQLYNSSLALQDLPKNAPVTAYSNGERNPKIDEQANSLRQCITVLFAFQRRPCKDATFVKDSREWLLKMAAYLLRIATMEDHLFLLNHVMRCPTSVSKWAACLLQIPRLFSPHFNDSLSFQTPYLDHLLTVLYSLLIYPKGRDELLSQFSLTSITTPDKTAENPWTFVDSDGEEDEDAPNCWQYPSENDMILLLKQISLEDIFSQILFMNCNQDHYDYDVSRTSESSMMKTIAFTHVMIDVLGSGLQTWSLGRYRQFGKRLAKLISDSVQHVFNHWENFKKLYPQLPQLTRARIQLELDQLCLKALVILLSFHKQGTWLFIAHLPFDSVSENAAWQVLALMLQCPDSGKNSIIADADTKHAAGGNSKRPSLAEVLSSLSPSELTHMLTTLANLACVRPNTETDLLEVLVHDIYEISYINSQTRELCSKQGRLLFVSIVASHPFTVSLLLREVAATVEKVGPMALHLFNALPLSQWVPMDATDWVMLRHWILEFASTSIENQLARLIIEHLNWGTAEQGQRLFLDEEVHFRMALLIAEACTVHLKGKAISGLFTDGSKQAADAIKLGLSDDFSFATWCWQLVLRLRLHKSQIGNQSPSSPVLVSDHRLQPLRTAIADGQTPAVFLALLICDLGNRTNSFLSDGMLMLSTLVDRQHYIPALHVLAYVTPMFFSTPEALINNEKFRNLLLSIIQSYSTYRKGIFTGEYPGPVLILLSSLLHHQMSWASQQSIQDGQSVFGFWINLLTSLSGWLNDRCCLFLIDNILRCAFLNELIWKYACDIFIDITKRCNQKADGSKWSLFAWLSTGNTKQSFIESASCAEFAYYAYAVISAEMAWEEETGIWMEVQRQIVAGNSSLETAYKKACSGLKVDNYPVLQRLSIYRWAQQAIDMDYSHPILPLVWQQFLLRFLARRCLVSGIPQAASLGLKFFEGGNAPITKRMKKRLIETADYYRKRATEAREFLAAVNQENSEGKTSALDLRQPEFYDQLSRYYQTVSFWVDEQLLHDRNLYLPSLPKEYEADRLLTLIQHQLTPWMDVVHVDLITSQVNEATKNWISHLMHDCDDGNKSTTSRPAMVLNPVERIISRVQKLRNDSSPQPPPTLGKFSCVSSELSSGVILDQSALLQALKAEFMAITEHAKLYGIRFSKLCSLDIDYIEILPQLYHNAPTEVVLKVGCKSTFNPLHRCKGQATFNCRYEAKTRRENVYRRIGENRAEHKQLLIESTLPPAQNICIAAVKINSTIRKLASILSTCSSEKVRSNLFTVGTSLFYHVTTYINDETQFYIPSKQFLSKMIDSLGQLFIRNNSSQAQTIMQTILQSPRLAGLLAPFFQPNQSPLLFLQMYNDMLPISSSQGPEIALMLLSKFDISHWLNSNQPVLSERSELVDIIGYALCRCGQNPSEKMMPIFQIYCNHLQILLAFQWPIHLGSILKIIVKGSSQNELSAHVWTLFLSTLGCLLNQENINNIAANKATVDINLLSASQIAELMSWLGLYFTTSRQNSNSAVTFGLYPSWKTYVQYIAQLLHFFAKRSVDLSREVAFKTSLEVEYATENLWKQITDSFAPWIQPHDQQAPWIQADVTQASLMVSMWTSSVDRLQTAFQDLLPVFTRNALSHLWFYYVGSIAKETSPDHVMQVFHVNMMSLPWQRLIPELQTIETMVKIVQGDGYPKSSLEFFAKIFPTIQWAFIVDCYVRSELPAIVSQLHALVFTLFVLLSLSKSIKQDSRFNELLSQSEYFQWSTMTSEAYDHGVNLLLQRCEADWLMSLSTDNMSPKVIRFLRVTSGFDSTLSHSNVEPNSVEKQLHYVRCLGQMISRGSFVKQVNIAVLQRHLQDLIVEVNNIASKVTVPLERHNLAIMFSNQLFTILNQSSVHADCQQSLQNVFTQWISSNKDSTLIKPFIVSACHIIASIPCLVVLLEYCCEAYFDSGHSDIAGWQELVSLFQVPDLSRAAFLGEALRAGCYLVLQIVSVQQLVQVKSLADELAQLTQLVHWIETAKPQLQNESKLYLWWVKSIELILRQQDFGGDCAILRQLLSKLLDSVILFAEDKSSSGFLGAIGLGKKSSLSARFRMVAKMWATFLSAQITANGTVRLQPAEDGCPYDPRRPVPSTTKAVRPTQRTNQLLAQLVNQLTSAQKQPTTANDKLAPNMSFAEFLRQYDYAISFICCTQYSLRDSARFLVYLVGHFFPDKSYLTVLQLSS